MQSKGVDAVAIWEEIFLGKSNNEGSEVGIYLSPHTASVRVMQSKARGNGCTFKKRQVWGYLA